MNQNGESIITEIIEKMNVQVQIFRSFYFFAGIF